MSAPEKCILADITGERHALALGIAVNASSPVLALCRALVQAGHNPATPLAAYRGHMLCLRVRSIGQGARLEINSEGTGFRWRPPPGTARPVASHDAALVDEPEEAAP